MIIFAAMQLVSVSVVAEYSMEKYIFCADEKKIEWTKRKEEKAL